VTKSSNHTLSFHRPTSNSPLTMNFPWLSPTDNWTLSLTKQIFTSLHFTSLHFTSLHFTQLNEFPFPYFPISSRHGPHRKYSFHYYCVARVLERLPSCCLAVLWSNPLQHIHNDWNNGMIVTTGSEGYRSRQDSVRTSSSGETTIRWGWNQATRIVSNQYSWQLLNR
jgi:hypothetical protein